MADTTTDVGGTWAGTYAYRAERLARPRSVEELQELVAGTRRVHALGSRHSFTDLADTDGTLVDLSGLPGQVAVDASTRSVRVAAGVRYGELAVALEAQGWALANLASLPHISVAGSVATGTHGSGVRNQTLSASVRALELVRADGSLERLERGQPEFDGSVVALGALGVVVALDLDVEPTFTVRQAVRTGVRWADLEERWDELLSCGYSVSLFTRFDPDHLEQVWVKARADEPAPGSLPGTRADRPTHMLLDAPTEALTRQGGVEGPWLDRLPHFRMAFTPSRGEEIQSEYYVPREHGPAGLAALRHVSPALAGVLQVCEVRTVAADDLWLSGAYGRDTVAFHFTWHRDAHAVLAAARHIEDALLPLGARPHWGKVFVADAAALREAFPRIGDFVALRDRVDPEGRFDNAFLRRALG